MAEPRGGAELRGGAQLRGGAELVVLADESAVARDAARRTIDGLAAGIARNGAAHLALTGGSTAVPLLRELADPVHRAALDWGKVHLWWGDERFVPIDHPESNAGMAYRLLLGMPAQAGESGSGAQYVDVQAGAVAGLPVDAQNVHPVEVAESLGDSEPADLAAQLYRAELTRALPLARRGLPRFDVILSGVGPDGHIMSIFPGSPALADDAETVVAVPAPDHVEPHLARVTLSAQLLRVAHLVVVMVSGAAKADIVSRVLGAEHDVERWPAQSALLPNAVWLLDSAAAAQVEGAGQPEPRAGEV